MVSKDINTITGNLLMTLQKFQDRVYHETPHKVSTFKLPGRRVALLNLSKKIMVNLTVNYVAIGSRD